MSALLLLLGAVATGSSATPPARPTPSVELRRVWEAPRAVADWFSKLDSLLA